VLFLHLAGLSRFAITRRPLRLLLELAPGSNRLRITAGEFAENKQTSGHGPVIIVITTFNSNYVILRGREICDVQFDRRIRVARSHGSVRDESPGKIIREREVPVKIFCQPYTQAISRIMFLGNCTMKRALGLAGQFAYTLQNWKIKAETLIAITMGRRHATIRVAGDQRAGSLRRVTSACYRIFVWNKCVRPYESSVNSRDTFPRLISLSLTFPLPPRQSASDTAISYN